MTVLFVVFGQYVFIMEAVGQPLPIKVNAEIMKGRDGEECRTDEAKRCGK